MRSQPFRLLVALLAVVLLALSMATVLGCGGTETTETSAPTPETSATTLQSTDSAPPAPDTTMPEEMTSENVSIIGAEDLSSTIVLPDGWAMEDALTAADVEAVVGRTGLQFWPEPNSSASSSKPAGSFYDGESIETKIFFQVIAKGGMAEYERLTGFVEDGEEVASDLWDELIVGEAKLVDYPLVQTLVLRDDVCMSIQWRPEHYVEFDRLAMGCSLADLLIVSLYKAE